MMINECIPLPKGQSPIRVITPRGTGVIIGTWHGLPNVKLDCVPEGMFPENNTPKTVCMAFPVHVVQVITYQDPPMMLDTMMSQIIPSRASFRDALNRVLDQERVPQ